MARPLRIEYADAYYHVTCRGNDRRPIFRDDDDRATFAARLENSLSIYGVRAHAYVLMQNHFHLILQTPNANLSDFMRHFNVSYTGYFNRRHKRTGHLYHGRFKAILVEADRYLLELSRYLHLNPVRIGPWRRIAYQEQVGHLWRYSWSSLPGYVSARRQIPWMTYEHVLAYCNGSRIKYGRFVQDGLERGYETPWKQVQGQVVLGDQAFWRTVKTHVGRSNADANEHPSIRSLDKRTPVEILGRVAAYFDLDPRRLERKRSGHRDERAILMELMYRHARMTLREVGRHLGGMDYTAVSHERRRLRERLRADQTLSSAYQELERQLQVSHPGI